VFKATVQLGHTSCHQLGCLLMLLIEFNSDQLSDSTKVYDSWSELMWH
jgi:hypothetical protein